MKFFTIDDEDDITVHADRPAALEYETLNPGCGIMIFDSLETLEEWDFSLNRIVDIHNGLTGTIPVKSFPSVSLGYKRIWEAIQSLELPSERQEPEIPAETETTEPPAEEPVTKEETVGTKKKKKAASKKAKTSKTPKVKASKAQKKAPGKPKAAPKAPKTPKTTTKAPKAPRKARGPRDDTKSAAILALLKRKDGATLGELMQEMGWQAHSVRGYISGTIQKKLGLKVESTRNEKKERTYRLI